MPMLKFLSLLCIAICFKATPLPGHNEPHVIANARKVLHMTKHSPITLQLVLIRTFIEYLMLNTSFYHEKKDTNALTKYTSTLSILNGAHDHCMLTGDLNIIADYIFPMLTHRMLSTEEINKLQAEYNRSKDSAKKTMILVTCLMIISTKHIDSIYQKKYDHTVIKESIKLCFLRPPTTKLKILKKLGKTILKALPFSNKYFPIDPEHKHYYTMHQIAAKAIAQTPNDIDISELYQALHRIINAHTYSDPYVQYVYQTNGEIVITRSAIQIDTSNPTDSKKHEWEKVIKLLHRPFLYDSMEKNFAKITLLTFFAHEIFQNNYNRFINDKFGLMLRTILQFVIIPIPVLIAAYTLIAGAINPNLAPIPLFASTLLMYPFIYFAWNISLAKRELGNALQEENTSHYNPRFV